MSGKRAAGKSGMTAGPADSPVGEMSRSLQRQTRQRRRRRTLRIVGISTAGVMVVAGSGVAYAYFHLLGNIKTSALYTGSNRAAAVGVEKADAFGRTPLNILLIGSDTRDTSEDAKLGGDAGPGAHADVEMLVHLSADRSNITVMSIPRDTVTQLPDCAGDATTIITDSLQNGPSCTAEAVHKLTGITVDDFAMVDFGGVVNISNALGGVNVCVNSNVYDVYSGLKLSEGTHSLKGTAALEFLRTRHAFGDGSDNVGRTTATHIFFTDMINKLKNAGTLTDPVAMYDIADAATKSLTVSPDLDSASKLIDLADDLNKVPTNRITFTTMQNVAYSGTDSALADDVQEETAQAQPLFNAIKNDQSLTTASGKASGAGQASASPVAAPPAAGTITVAVYNGTSVDGRSDAIANQLVSQGFNSATAGYPDSASPATTTLTYGPGEAAQAQVVAKDLGLPAKALVQGTATGLKLVIGADWTSGNTFPHSSATPAPVSSAVLLNGATGVQTANQVNQCVDVSTAYTEPGHTPQSEYADNPQVPNSAP